MATTLANLRTFCQDRMQDASETKMERIFDRAINQAFRYIASFDFPFWRKEGRITTRPSYNTGSVVATQDSNIVSAMSGAVFSAGHAEWGMTVGAAREAFRVASGVISSLTFNTGWDYLETTNSAASYTLYKDKIAMPTDLRKFDRLRDEALVWPLRYLSPEQFYDYKNSTGAVGDYPQYYTVDQDYFFLWPYPTTREPISFWYYRWPTVLTTGTDNMDWDENAKELAFDVLDVTLRMNDPITEQRMNPAKGLKIVEALCHPWLQKFNNMQEETRYNVMNPLGGRGGLAQDWGIGSDIS